MHKWFIKVTPNAEALWHLKVDPVLKNNAHFHSCLILLNPAWTIFIRILDTNPSNMSQNWLFILNRLFNAIVLPISIIKGLFTMILIIIRILTINVIFNEYFGNPASKNGFFLFRLLSIHTLKLFAHLYVRFSWPNGWIKFLTFFEGTHWYPGDPEGGGSWWHGQKKYGIFKIKGNAGHFS